MKNNAEIRQRMDTYRSILLVINWIGSIIGIIAGFVLMSRLLGGYGFIIIIISAFLGVIGHFLINVTLAIPFILLNNGDKMDKNIMLQKQLLIHYGVSESIIDNFVEVKEKTLTNKDVYNDLLEKFLIKNPVYLRAEIENIKETQGIEKAIDEMKSRLNKW